jgi:hypothetical protein
MCIKIFVKYKDIVEVDEYMSLMLYITLPHRSSRTPQTPQGLLRNSSEIS